MKKWSSRVLFLLNHFFSLTDYDIYNWIYLPYNDFVSSVYMMGVYVFMGNQNDVMTKAEAMDNLIASYEKGVSSTEIITIIYQVFKLNLESATLDLPTPPRATIDAYLEHCGNEATGAEIRRMFNQTFGINLDALSALEGSKFSLYSKGQWMVQHEKDLFVSTYRNR